MNVLDYLKAPLQWAFLLIANIVLDLIGLVMVAIALPFATWQISVSDGRAILNLPRWAYLWGNDFDGVLGDKRGDWAKITPFGVHVESYLAKYWWTAIRNPSNNMRMYDMFAAPIIGSVITFIGDREVRDSSGEGGWQFVKLVSAKGKNYYGFYLVWQLTDNHGFYARFGFKISPDHQGTQELPKGETVRINPWKTL